MKAKIVSVKMKAKIVDINGNQNIEFFDISTGTEDICYNEEMNTWRRFPTQEAAKKCAKDLITKRHFSKMRKTK